MKVNPITQRQRRGLHTRWGMHKHRHSLHYRVRFRLEMIARRRMFIPIRGVA